MLSAVLKKLTFGYAKTYYISSLLSHRKCSRSLRSSGQELLTVPLAKLRAFSIAAPRQWNNLPLSIRKSPPIAIFERHLKIYLF